MTQEIVAQLNQQGLSRYDEVMTQDGQFYGKAFTIHHRPDTDVNPKLKRYAHYLKTVNLKMGNGRFVPLDFVDRYDADKGVLHLSVDLEYALRNTWGRVPDFVARNLGEIDELPQGDKTFI